MTRFVTFCCSGFPRVSTFIAASGCGAAGLRPSLTNSTQRVATLRLVYLVTTIRMLEGPLAKLSLGKIIARPPFYDGRT